MTNLQEAAAARTAIFEVVSMAERGLYDDWTSRQLAITGDREAFHEQVQVSSVMMTNTLGRPIGLIAASPGALNYIVDEIYEGILADPKLWTDLLVKLINTRISLRQERLSELSDLEVEQEVEHFRNELLKEGSTKLVEQRPDILLTDPQAIKRLTEIAITGGPAGQKCGELVAALLELKNRTRRA